LFLAPFSHTPLYQLLQQLVLSPGMARTIYIRCTYGIFGREITKNTVIYGVYIRFWPTLAITPWQISLAPKPFRPWLHSRFFSLFLLTQSACPAACATASKALFLSQSLTPLNHSQQHACYYFLIMNWGLRPTAPFDHAHSTLSISSSACYFTFWLLLEASNLSDGELTFLFFTPHLYYIL
jgi:hypothetical protein